MKKFNDKLTSFWAGLGPQFLPFADAATDDLPLGRLLRLSLFQVTVGMAFVLFNGTLNRVMIVELEVPTWLVSLMVASPLLFAPFRTFLGFRSDNHRSYLGWKRVPYLWAGTLMAFGGLSILPFALVLISEGEGVALWSGYIASAIAFFLVGAGMHTTQTAGIALASDLAPANKRHRVVALLYAMLLLGMVVSSLAFSVLLANFSQVKLIQVVQSAALVTVVLNTIAVWKQEPRNPAATRHNLPMPSFKSQWNKYLQKGRAQRLLVAVGLGSAGFALQDILLEPYGGEILGLTVGQTTFLMTLLSLGMLVGFGLAGRWLELDFDPIRLAAMGLMVGILAFSAVIFAAPLHSANLFRVGAFLIGIGCGLFTVGTLTAAMLEVTANDSGLALGAWGAVQATSVGLAIAASGGMRDVVSHLAMSGKLGPAMINAATGYSFVYHIEIAFLFASLLAVGPLVRRVSTTELASDGNLNLTQQTA